MKKLYFLLFTLLITSVSFGQVFITEIADPNNSANARYIELYNAGASAVDFTEGNGWQIDKYRNNVSTLDSSIDLTGTIAAGDYYLIAYDFTSGTFATVYGFAADQLDSVQDGVAGSNGDDDLFLINGSDAIVDAWGDTVPGVSNTDNSGTCAEYEDGRAERLASVTGPNGTWDETEWNVWADSTVSGCTSHVNSPRTAPEDFDPGNWIGDPNYCAVSFGTVTYTCSTNTAGDNNDSVTINIPYSNLDGGITSVTTSSGGTIGGNDPATEADGTITITGLSEGSAWDITLNGGNCDGTTSSGNVPAAECDPQFLIINEIHADPDLTLGDANGDGAVDGTADEFVEIYNSDTNSIDLENYTIEDGFGLRHTFPANSVVPAGGFITIFGGGTPTGISGISQVASSNQLGLNNGGDTVNLKNTTGFVVASHDYGSEGGDNQSIGRDPDFTGPFVKHSLIASSGFLFSPGLENDDPSLSIFNFETNEFSIYPNPTSNGFVNITSSNSEAIQAQVFDILGKQVLNNTISNNRLNVSSLNAGLYIVKLIQDNASVTKKLIIK